jgi:L-threonylcarbamoyladenylate synthase
MSREDIKEENRVIIAEGNAMKTLVLKVDPYKPEAEQIETAAKIIREGGLVAFPTETVYGLGADALNGDAVLRLFEAKKRPLDNPPIVHVSKKADVALLVQEIPRKAQLLIDKFWPGPLTLVLKHSTKVPKVTTAGMDTVAIRMPTHAVAVALIKASGCPIAAPSANLSGKPSPTSAEHVYEDLNGRINAILDGGATYIGIESTVVDLSADPPMLLRPGGLPFETLKEVLPDLVLHPFVAAETEISAEKARSPGMKHKHYAPKAPVILVEGDLHAVVSKVNELIETYKHEGKRVWVLATEETKSGYKTDAIRSLGTRSNVATIAANLFRLLREVDVIGVDVIIAEGVPPEGLGLAIMNRLRKASGYHIVKA